MQPLAALFIPGISILLILTVFLVFACVTIFTFYRRYYGREKAFLVSFATLFCTIGSVVWRYFTLEHLSDTLGTPEPAILPLISLGLLVPAAISFLLKLHSKWVDGHLSESERAPGGVGIRAWLSTGNIVFIISIALLSYVALGISFIVMIAILIAALIAYPLLNSPEPTAAVPAQRQSEDVSAERERILRMLESGKITPEESTDLLNALGTTIVPEIPQRSEPLTTNRRLILSGAALVLLGFFLPWFSIDPVKELGQLSGQMQNMMNGIMRQNSFPMLQNMPGFPLQNFQQVQQSGQRDTTIDIAGGDMPHGLGWLVLVIALASAALPYIATHMDHKTQTTVSLFALGIGSIVVLYLLSREFDLIAIGLILTALGYALAFIGALKESKSST